MSSIEEGVLRVKGTPHTGQPLTILMLVDVLNIGGTETHVLTLSKQLLRQGHRVIIGTSGGPFMPVFRAAGLETAFLPFQTDNPRSGELTALLASTREIITTQNVDVVHAHFSGGMKIATRLAEELDIPTVITVHGLFYPVQQMRGVVDSCHRFIAVSKPVATWLTKRLDARADHVSVIPNGIDTSLYTPGERMNGFREELGIGEDEHLVLTCSRIAWGKTRVVAAAIEAVMELAGQENLRLVVVGSGPDAPLVQVAAAMANRRAQRDLVTLLGWRSELAEAYQAADTVIGTARVALEAMSCSRPVIAAGNAGYVGVVQPDVYDKAWDVYFGDHQALQSVSAKQLVTDLQWLLTNGAEAQEIGYRGHLWVNNDFTVEQVAQQVEGVYLSLLQRKGVVADVPVANRASDVTRAQSVVKRNGPPMAGNTYTGGGYRPSPLVSVAIPAYNAGQYLSMCLDALVAQAYRPLEIVIVDDGSTDDTEQVVRAWWELVSADTELTHVYHKLPHNLGFAYAQSVAYFLSHGQFIANHDADDVSHVERFALQVPFLLQNTDYSLVGSNYAWFEGDPTHIHTVLPWIKYGEEIVRSYGNGQHCVCFGSLLMRRAVVEKLGGLTSFAEGAEDFEFVARAITQGFKVENLRQVLYYYRKHAGQRSREYYTLRDRLQGAQTSGKKLGVLR